MRLKHTNNYTFQRNCAKGGKINVSRIYNLCRLRMSNMFKNYACSKTDLIDDPCIDCIGVPPYAPFEADETNLHEFSCDKKKSSIIRIVE